MKGLIVYATKYGSVTAAVNRLLTYLPQSVDVVNLQHQTVSTDLTQYDFVLVGGSVYAGKIQKAVIHFLENYVGILLQRPLGLFACAGELDKEKQIQQLKKVFPQPFVERATAMAVLGEAVYMEKVNFIEKLIIRLLKGTTTSYEKFDEEAMQLLAQKMLGKELK